MKRLINTWILPENFKKNVEQDSDTDTNYSWINWSGLQRSRKENGEPRDREKNLDHLDHTTVTISSKTKKKSGDQWGLTVTQTSVKDNE